MRLLKVLAASAVVGVIGCLVALVLMAFMLITTWVDSVWGTAFAFIAACVLIGVCVGAFMGIVDS